MAIPITRQFGLATAVQTTFVIIALAAMITFAWILVMLSVKLLGVALLLCGIWMTIYFPWQSDYQKASFTGTGRMIGVILLAAGLALLIYG